MLNTSETFKALYDSPSRRAEYRCIPVPGLLSANNPGHTVEQTAFSGQPILTQGYGDVEELLLGNVFTGTLSLKVRDDNFPSTPYRMNDCMQFEMRYTSIESPPETISEWLPLGRFIVDKADYDKARHEYIIEASDACSLLDRFEIEKALGSVPEMSLPTTYRDIWERLDAMLVEYCRLNGLWDIHMPPIPIIGNTPVDSVHGVKTREILVYIMLAWAGNMRANSSGSLVIENIPEIALRSPKQDVYWESFIPGEPELPIGVVRMSGGLATEDRIYPDGANIPTPADGVSLFDYYSPWYGEGQSAYVYGQLSGFANKPFEAETCYPDPAIEPGDVVKISGEDYLVMYQRMTCGADPVFTLSCGTLSSEKYRGTVDRRVDSALDGGTGVSAHSQITLDHLPTQEEEAKIRDNTIVHVYETVPAPFSSGTLYPIISSYIKLSEIPLDFSFVISGDSYTLRFIYLEENPPEFTVHWGDGETDSIDGSDSSKFSHTYPESGEWAITIRDYKGGNFWFRDDEKLLRILTPFPASETMRFSDGGYGICEACRNLSFVPAGLFQRCPNAEIFDACLSRCYSLESIPERLFARCISAKSFSRSFSECERIGFIPEKLFSECKNAENFSGCFSGTRISAIPEFLFAPCLKARNFRTCFQNCRSLTSIPEKLFANLYLADDFSSCFSGTSIESIPVNLFLNNGNAKNFARTFSSCDLLSDVPPGVFYSAPLAETFEGCFSYCIRLTSFYKYSFQNNGKAKTFYYCFAGCEELSMDISELFVNNHAVENFIDCFNSCISLYGNAPSLWNRSNPTPSGDRCFRYCTGLSNYNDIPSNWK